MGTNNGMIIFDSSMLFENGRSRTFTIFEHNFTANLKTNIFLRKQKKNN